MKAAEIKNVAFIFKGMEKAPTLTIEGAEGSEEIKLVSGFNVHSANEILRELTDLYSLDYEIYFKTWAQYMELVEIVNAGIKKGDKKQ